MTTRSVAQAQHERVAGLVLEIDADYCNNDFGIGVCTAGRIGNGTAQAAALKSLTLAAAASAVDDYYKNMTVAITSGAGASQSRSVSGYVGSTKIATVDAWASNLQTYSEDATQASWTKINCTASSGGTTINGSPAMRATMTGGAVTHQLYGVSTPVVLGQPYARAITVDVTGLATKYIYMEVGEFIADFTWTSPTSITISGNAPFKAAVVHGDYQATLYLKATPVSLLNRSLYISTTAAINIDGQYLYATRLQTRKDDPSIPFDYITTVASAVSPPDSTSVYNIINRPAACYNTYGGCQDKPNFAKGIKTIKFCTRGMPIPSGEPLRPYIQDGYSFTPTEIPLGGGLAVRSNHTLTLADEACTDFELDKYALARPTPAGGSFWARFIARNYNIAGRVARLKKGYITTPFDWTTFQTETYVIESLKGLDSSGNVQAILSDVVKPLDKNLLPAPTSGKLQADFKGTEYRAYVLSGDAQHITFGADASPLDSYYNGMECYITANTGSGQRRVILSYIGASRTATISSGTADWSVIPDTTSIAELSALSINVGSGNGTQYADPVATGLAQFVCIGKEVIRYNTVAGDVLSWSSSASRAQFGTPREDHKMSDGIQYCFAVIDQSASVVIKKLFNGAGILDANIDIAGLTVEDNNWLGSAARITACIPVSTKANQLCDELLKDLNIGSWWDAVASLQRFKVDLPQLNTTVKSITPDETILSSLQVEQLDSLRISQAFISYAPYSVTQIQADRNNYKITEGFQDVGAESANEYNNTIQSQVYSRWLSAANLLHARAITARKIGRFRNAPNKVKLKLDPRDEVFLSDLVDVTSRKKTDASGAPLTQRMRVTKLLQSGNFEIEAVSTTFTGRAGFIAPDGTADYPTDTLYAHASSSAGLMIDGTQGYTII